MAENYELIAEQSEMTVVASYPIPAFRIEGSQSEQQMEDRLLEQLVAQGYERLHIHTEAEMLVNLRKQIEALNDVSFTDKDWDRFFSTFISNANMGIVEKTTTIQNDSTKTFAFDDGSMRNIKLIDKKYIHRNHLQVLNQYEEENGRHKTRYDVTILVNGLPLVHCELKKRGVRIREAFNQIKRYNRDSFWAGCGLYEYVQIFIISNGTETKYYSNTTRQKHIKEQASSKPASGKLTSNSFEFTNYWAAADNKRIIDIEDFTATFLSRHTLLNVLTRYCILDIDNNLLVMRPYQIAATEAIMQRIKVSSNHKDWFGSTKAGGYIWHTTGSGKTLTSFKTARQCCELPDVDKVLFVVDRKDLDYQTMREYDRFEKGAANSTKNTAALKKQLEAPNGKIVITTIQKLSVFIKQNPSHPVYGKHVVMIFDECHRSQFGEMHHEIVSKFKKYHIFGFTGTPIFVENAMGGKYANMLTTEQAFGDRLHTYTITSAIRDENVLPFRIDYVQSMVSREDMKDEQIYKIAGEHARLSKERISNIVRYVLENYAFKTKRNQTYTFKQQPVCGFNSIFACESITAAKLYYAEFQRQMEQMHPNKRLKIALIYSYAANADDPDEAGLIGALGEENSEDTSGLSIDDRTFLDLAIKQYNETFACNFSTDGGHFQDYYKDVSMRMKNRDLDMLIVVNMFLTGFDATTLNTLWVDKNLQMHGLLQAYSRTNRILNSIKTFGNIVCFRALENETNKALELFGGEGSNSVVLLRSYEEYIFGYDDEQYRHHIGYVEMVAELLTKYPLGHEFKDEKAEKAFINLFGSIRRALNILQCFDQFGKNPPVDFQESVLNNYTSLYLDLRDKYMTKAEEEETDVNNDISFETELVRQTEVSISYILHLVEKAKGQVPEDLEIALNRIKFAIGASPDLRDKRQLIEEFINAYSPDKDVHDEWNAFVSESQKAELQQLTQEENMNYEKTYAFMRDAFKDGAIPEEGTAIIDILPPSARSFFSRNRAETKKRILNKCKAYFDKYYPISGGIFPRGEAAEAEEGPAFVTAAEAPPHDPNHISFDDMLREANLLPTSAPARQAPNAQRAQERSADSPKREKKTYSEGTFMKTLAIRQPWAQLIVMGIKDIECRDSMPTKCRKIFVAASGTKDSWNDLPPYVQQLIEELVAAGKMPAYKDLPTKCIIGHVDIVKASFDAVDSIWGRDWDGMKYTLRNAEMLDDPLFGLNKATPYFYNVEGYSENNLPASHKVDLTGIKLPE